MKKDFINIPTTCISDCDNGLNNMDASIKPLQEGFKLAGKAFTVKMPVGDNLAVLEAIRSAEPGDVLVIDAKGDTYRAFAGDFILGLAKTLGIQGIVCDGVVRDIEGIKELNFPVFCKGTTIAASSKTGWGETNIPISCGGTTVNPGDIVVGDADGVVVIPKEQEESIYTKAKEKLQKDIERAEAITGNAEKSRQYLDDMLLKNK